MDRPTGAGDPHPSIPDHLPPDLEELYGPQARRTVLASRRRPTSRVRALVATLCDPEVCWMAGLIFMAGVMLLGMLAGLAYLLARWPIVTIAIAAPTLALLATSCLLAARIVRRNHLRDP